MKDEGYITLPLTLFNNKTTLGADSYIIVGQPYYRINPVIPLFVRKDNRFSGVRELASPGSGKAQCGSASPQVCDLLGNATTTCKRREA